MLKEISLVFYTKLISFMMILLLVCLLCIVSVEPCIYCCKCGDLTPINPYIILNGTLELQCQLNETSLGQDVNSSKLFFTYGLKSKRVEDMYVTKPDNRTAILRKVLTSADDAVSYRCQIDGKFGKDGIVGSQKVNVEYPVHALKNFQCEVYDWDKNMTCWWDVGDYIDIRNIDVTMYGHNGNSHECPKLYKTKCEWPDPASASGMNSIITDVFEWRFAVIVQNKRNHSQNNYIIQTKEIVKPAKVKKFTVEDVGNNTLDLKWVMAMRHRDQIFKIRYWSTKWNISNEFLTENKANSTRIEGLRPYTMFEFSIQIRPFYNNKQTGYWSDSVNITYRTPSDVPSMPPTLGMGSFERNTELCTEKNGFQNNVTVFWKEIPEIKRNGIISHYEIKYTDLKSNLSVTKSIYVTEKTMLSTTLELNCTKMYNVSVRAGTVAGLSEDSSTIIIPSNKDIQTPWSILIEADDVNGKDQLNISWKYTSVQQYTLYWCNGKCLSSEIKWIHLPIEKTWYTLKEDELGDLNALSFGVSADSTALSSGFKWHTCIYKKSGVPRPPLDVKILSSLDGLKVLWGRPVCDGYSAYPMYYKVTWCLAPGEKNLCEGMIKEHFILYSDTFMYTITDVEMKQKYGVQVYSLSANGLSSQVQEMIYGIPTTNDFSDSEIGGIAGGSILGVIVLFAGLTCIIRNIHAYFKKMVKPVEITIPDFEQKIVNSSDPSPESNYFGVLSGSSSPVEGDHLLFRGQAERTVNGLFRPNYIHQSSNDSGRGSLEISPAIPAVKPKIPPTDSPNSDLDIPTGYAKVSAQLLFDNFYEKIKPQEVIVKHVSCPQVPMITSKLLCGSHVTCSSSDISGMASYQSVLQRSSSEYTTDCSPYLNQKSDEDTTLDTVDEDSEEEISSLSSNEGNVLKDITEKTEENESKTQTSTAKVINLECDTCPVISTGNVNMKIMDEQKCAPRNMCNTYPSVMGNNQKHPLPNLSHDTENGSFAPNVTSSEISSPVTSCSISSNDDYLAVGGDGNIVFPSSIGINDASYRKTTSGQDIFADNVIIHCQQEDYSSSSSDIMSIASSNDLSHKDICIDGNQCMTVMNNKDVQNADEVNLQQNKCLLTTNSAVDLHKNQRNCVKTGIEFSSVIEIDLESSFENEGYDWDADLNSADLIVNSEDYSNNNGSSDISSSICYSDGYSIFPIRSPGNSYSKYQSQGEY